MAPDPSGPSAPAYAVAGVDVDANTRLIPRYRELARGASRPEVLADVGSFGGLFDLGGYRDPVLVASTDGVGTKVLIARMLGRYGSVGEDLVNHCVNDILTAGARPLFFLDYLASHGLGEDDKVAVVAGVARACRAAGLALLGGETADLPDLYRWGDFDLAGTIVGVVQRDHIIDGSAIAPGDRLFALPSSGLHTNGYALVRAILGLGRDGDSEQDRRIFAERSPELGESLGDALLRPHRCYWPLLEPVLERCKGIAHITGGGIAENLARVLPAGMAATVRRGTWPEPPIFALIQRRGEVSEAEMLRVFNLGAGMILVVAPADAAGLREALPEAVLIGEVRAADGEPRVAIEPPAAHSG